MASGPVLQSIITCPKCGHRAEETMPTNACLFFYECSECGATLKPKSGDCCVFCSYGSVPCPPIQVGAAPGCELMAVPGVLFGKHTELACLIFSPLDRFERKLRSKRGV